MIHAEVGLDRAASALPIFPLPRTVLLPGSMLPLHVFEPRYQALVKHCRSNWELMGIATLLQTDGAGQHEPPPVHPVVGVGRIVAYEPLADGRSNILLEYVGAGLVRRELPSEEPFRVVDLDLRQEVPPDTGRIYEEVRALVGAVGQLSEQARKTSVRLTGLEGSEMLDALARKLLIDTEDKLRYLAEQRIESRGAIVADALSEVLVAASVGSAEA